VATLLANETLQPSQVALLIVVEVQSLEEHAAVSGDVTSHNVIMVVLIPASMAPRSRVALRTKFGHMASLVAVEAERHRASQVEMVPEAEVAHLRLDDFGLGAPFRVVARLAQCYSIT
jgi:hypothetical protein